jgi:cytoskeletal protein CcmA (bactofilin family)
MWKRRDDERPVAPPPAPIVPVIAPKEVRPVETPKPESFRADVAHIGKSVIVKGELSGSEDLYLDGEVEGSIELKGHSLIIGPNGRVRANVHARDIVVHGKVDGNLRGSDRVELKKSSILVGDIYTQRIVIEDGAFFKGAVDLQKETPKPEAKPEIKEVKRESVMAGAAGAGSATAASTTTTPQTSLLDQKKF